MVEFADYGNLYESSAGLTVERLCRFTIQAASALEHLEAKKVIHQSLKPFNCLVVAKNEVRPPQFEECAHFTDVVSLVC